jgi:hypothetical protein
MNSQPIQVPESSSTKTMMKKRRRSYIIVVVVVVILVALLMGYLFLAFEIEIWPFQVPSVPLGPNLIFFSQFKEPGTNPTLTASQQAWVKQAGATEQAQLGVVALANGNPGNNYDAQQQLFPGLGATFGQCTKGVAADGSACTT